jgi:hypothetical protein
MQNDHLYGLLMDQQKYFASLFLKGTQIPKFHIFESYI